MTAAPAVFIHRVFHGAFQRAFFRAVCVCVPVLCGAAAQANDFPTAERVLYVLECMRAHAGPQFEMVSKCACALDTLAAEVHYDDYVTMSTISNAVTIAGERGGTIRDAPSLTPQVARYRSLRTAAEKACFLPPAGR